MAETCQRIDEIGFGGLRLIQNPQEFCYGIDAVILADFAAGIINFISENPKKKIEKVIDLGSGTGIIPLILSFKTKAEKIYGLEIQERAYKTACKNININSLDNRIEMLKGDVKEYFWEKGRNWGGSMDAVLTNPPYVKRGGGLPVQNPAKHIARHETSADLEEFVKAAAFLLKDNGHLLMVHRPSRLGDIISIMKNAGIEAKTLRMVHPYRGKEANILLIDGVKGGGKELIVLDPLYVYEKEGTYSPEIRKIYNE